MTCGEIGSSEIPGSRCKRSSTTGHVVVGLATITTRSPDYLPRDQDDHGDEAGLARCQPAHRASAAWLEIVQAEPQHARAVLSIENGHSSNTNCFHEELRFIYEKDGQAGDHRIAAHGSRSATGTLFGHRQASTNTVSRARGPGSYFEASSIRRGSNGAAENNPSRCDRFTSSDGP